MPLRTPPIQSAFLF